PRRNSTSLTASQSDGSPTISETQTPQKHGRELVTPESFHVLEGAVDSVFTDRVVLEFREFVEATGYPLNAAALRAETIRWEEPLQSQDHGLALILRALSPSRAGRRLFHACRGYWRIYGAVLWLRQRSLDPNVHNDELPLVEHQLVRVEAQRSRPDLAGF